MGMRTGWRRGRATTRVAPTTGLSGPIFIGIARVGCHRHHQARKWGWSRPTGSRDWIPAPYRGTGQALRRNDGIRWHAGYFQRNELPSAHRGENGCWFSLGLRSDGVITMDRVWLGCVRNHHGLAKATYGDENGLVPGTGNHKGCPYDGFVGAYFHRNRPCRLPPAPPNMKMGLEPAHRVPRLDSCPVSGYGAGSSPE